MRCHDSSTCQLSIPLPVAPRLAVASKPIQNREDSWNLRDSDVSEQATLVKLIPAFSSPCEHSSACCSIPAAPKSPAVSPRSTCPSPPCSVTVHCLSHPEESATAVTLVPPSPGRWSQDLLGGLDSEAEPAKTVGALDLLANDVILINTEARSLSTQREEEKQTDETAKETQSPTETVTITTKTVIITDKSEEDSADPWSSHVTTTVTESSSADPFDPYPIGTTSPNSSSDLLQPLVDISINSASTTFMETKDPSPDTNMSGSALKSLADDVIPINTDTTRSTENDSPWDRWTSPTVYTIKSTTGEEEGEEEEEEEESPEDTQSQTVTTITTIREIHSELEPAMDRHETYSSTVIEEDRRVQTPEPETKKGFVYVKEYVNATELSLHNATDSTDRGSDYLTSSSTSYSYSSPSTYSSGSMTSTCTYCGEQVGNDAKITIEHLNINCHPACFKCAVCSRPMGDLLYSMFLHGGKVHCESCYSKALD
ncbi:zinc finger protein 185 isoform X1 [Lates japonicus]|uniref:Zinc finger protein 185 isoform X1 n=1 Tax=Lates japonicus TaxID=270547 RepID=A0AAD3MYJ4_LATJO|nr:zinc finger protein 185 isoform X1 [Lates japonicus]